MSPASVEDIKKELQRLPPKKVLELTLRLARFKKENKELLTYLLFEAGDEQGYVQSLQFEIDEQLQRISKAPSATVKKQLRRITTLINRQSKYIGNKASSAELHLYLCFGLLNHPEKLLTITSANTIFHQQLNKASRLVPLLEEDLQHDFQLKIDQLNRAQTNAPASPRWWKRKNFK